MSEIGEAQDLIYLQEDRLRGLFEISMSLNEGPDVIEHAFVVFADLQYDIATKLHEAGQLLDEVASNKKAISQ